MTQKIVNRPVVQFIIALAFCQDRLRMWAGQSHLTVERKRVIGRNDIVWATERERLVQTVGVWYTLFLL